MNDEDSRTTSVGLARYAREFFEAAIAADDKIGDRPGYEISAPAPVMFLTAHAIELVLKAYLRFAGRSVREIIALKHDLEICWQEAKREGIEVCVALDDEELEVLRIINELHMSTELRYIRTGAKELPVYGSLQFLTQKLLGTICPLVGYK